MKRRPWFSFTRERWIFNEGHHPLSVGIFWRPRLALYLFVCAWLPVRFLVDVELPFGPIKRLELGWNRQHREPRFARGSP